ncbi:MAG: ATP-binding cassette domain-containing protein, partial [Mesorhizobium sp.]
MDVDLAVRRGECVGIAGLEGSGKAEFGSALAGLIKPDAGVVRIDGESFRLGDVRAALRAGIGYVPQNRHAQGMVTLLPVSENATMTATRMLARPLIPGLLDVLFQSDREKAYERLARQWQIVAASPQQLISE